MNKLIIRGARRGAGSGRHLVGGESAMSNESRWDYETNAGQTREAFERELPSHSRLLGPDGKPLQYEPQKLPRIGFDLSPRGKK